MASSDSTLYLYTSLTAGSSHVITATSRLETILKANKIPFRAIDCATDEKARMIWGRRSRGRKLPGLVRFGFVVGDLEQIEEWNEFGELKEQINATQDLGMGGGTTSAPAHPNTINIRATLHPEPPAPSLPLASPQLPSNPSSRASSQGRHISIEEPTAREKERDKDVEKHSPSESKPTSPASETPQNQLFRQLGAEAAAKAKDRKASGAKPAAIPTNPSDSTKTAQIPTPASTKSSADAESTANNPESTAARTPAQLATEGKTKTTTDKIETVTSPTGDEATSAEGKSTEEQKLELRRSSTQVLQSSRLSESTPVGESETVLPETKTEESKADGGKEADYVGTSSQTATATAITPVPESADKSSPTTSETLPTLSSSHPLPERRRSHRGSSLEEVDKEAIRKAEEAIRIQEEENEDQEDDVAIGGTSAGEEVKGVEKSESGGLESIDEKDEKVLKSVVVGVGKDVGSDEKIDGEDPVAAGEDVPETSLETKADEEKPPELGGIEEKGITKNENDADAEEEPEPPSEEVKKEDATQVDCPQAQVKDDNDVSEVEDAKTENAKQADAEKDKAQKNAEVSLPAGKEVDVESTEGNPEVVVKGSAKDPDEAGKTVGD